MRKAQVVNGVVVNVIEVDADHVPAFCAAWPDAGAAGPGWTHDGQAFAAPTVVVPVPEAVPKLALVRALRRTTLSGAATTSTAASAWPQVQAVLAGAPSETQEDWDLLTLVPRHDPTVLAFAAVLSVSSEIMDQVFILAQKIDSGAL